jgi:hypothetical protein
MFPSSRLRSVLPVLAAIALVVGIILCPRLAQAGYLDLAWNAPTTNVDGTALTDLSNYRVYFRTSSGSCGAGPNQAVPAASPTPGPGTVTYRLTGLMAGTAYWVTVAAVDSGGNVSTCSNEVSGVAKPEVAGSATLLSAVLPSSRSVPANVTATAFATVMAVGAGAPTACSVAPLTAAPVAFTYQTTNPVTNALTGTPNTPFDITAGGSRTLVLSLTPTAPFPPTDVPFSFQCADAGPAASIAGLNTLLLSASSTPAPDIVAVGVTPTHDGVVNVPGVAGTGFFAVATANVGAGGPITVSATTAVVGLPVSILLCQTNPATGACITGLASAVSANIAAGATPTFAIFITGLGNVPFDPAVNRVFVRFTDGGGVVRGATSVAIRTQ